MHGFPAALCGLCGREQGCVGVGGLQTAHVGSEEVSWRGAEVEFGVAGTQPRLAPQGLVGVLGGCCHLPPMNFSGVLASLSSSPGCGKLLVQGFSGQEHWRLAAPLAASAGWLSSPLRLQTVCVVQDAVLLEMHLSLVASEIPLLVFLQLMCSVENNVLLNSPSSDEFHVV